MIRQATNKTTARTRPAPHPARPARRGTPTTAPTHPARLGQGLHRLVQSALAQGDLQHPGHGQHGDAQAHGDPAGLGALVPPQKIDAQDGEANGQAEAGLAEHVGRTGAQGPARGADHVGVDAQGRQHAQQQEGQAPDVVGLLFHHGRQGLAPPGLGPRYLRRGPAAGTWLRRRSLAGPSLRGAAKSSGCHNNVKANIRPSPTGDRGASAGSAAARPPRPGPSDAAGQTSMTTGTIMGRRLVRSLTNRPSAVRARRLSVSKSATATSAPWGSSMASRTTERASSSSFSASGAYTQPRVIISAP